MDKIEGLDLIVGIYDNGGKTFDRYTIVIDDDIDKYYFSASHNCNSPQGVFMTIEPYDISNQKEVSFEDLPEDSRKFLERFCNNWYDDN